MGWPPAASTDISVVTATDETSKVQSFTLDASAKLVKRTKMKGATPLTTQYNRDLLSRIKTVLDPLGNKWTYGYDSLSRRISVADPDLGSWSYIYDAGSRLTSQTDAKGQMSALTYDAMSRVLTKAVTGSGLATETTANTYDEARSSFFNRGKLTTASRSVPAQTVAGAALPLSPSPASLITKLRAVFPRKPTSNPLATVWTAPWPRPFGLTVH